MTTNYGAATGCSLLTVNCNIAHGHLKCLKNVLKLFFFNFPYREVLIFNFSFENYDHLYVSVHVFFNFNPICHGEGGGGGFHPPEGKI